jgi:hypothetical protein
MSYRSLAMEESSLKKRQSNDKVITLSLWLARHWSSALAATIFVSAR